MKHLYLTIILFSSLCFAQSSVENYMGTQTIGFENFDDADTSGNSVPTGVIIGNLNSSTLSESTAQNPHGTGTKSFKVVVGGIPPTGSFSFLTLKMFSQKIVEDKGKYFFGIWVKAENPGLDGAKVALGWLNKTSEGNDSNNYSTDYILTDENWHFLVQATEFGTVSELAKMQPVVRFKSVSTLYLDDPIVYRGQVGGNMEWNHWNGNPKGATDFFESATYGGTTDQTTSIAYDTISYTGKQSIKFISSNLTTTAKRAVLQPKANTSNEYRFKHRSSPTINGKSYSTFTYLIGAWVKSDIAAEIQLRPFRTINNNSGVINDYYGPQKTLTPGIWTYIEAEFDIANMNDPMSLYWKMLVKTPSATVWVDDVKIRWHDSQTTFSIDEKHPNSLKIYPNPTNGIIHIDGNLLNENVEIYDISGRKVLSVNPEIKSIDVRSLNTGVYMIKSGNNFSKFLKK